MDSFGNLNYMILMTWRIKFVINFKF